MPIIHSRQRGFASALTLKRVRDLCGGFPDVVLEVAGIPKVCRRAPNRRGQQPVIEIGNISPGLTASIAPSMVTFKSIELTGAVKYPPHYLKMSLDFLSTHMERYPYRERCATRPSHCPRRRKRSTGANGGKVTCAALLPQAG
jgi:hypothetical protein